MITMEVRNYFKVSDYVEIFKLKIDKLIDEDGCSIDIARHPKQILKIPCKKKANKCDIIRIPYIY